MGWRRRDAGRGLTVAIESTYFVNPIGDTVTAAGYRDAGVAAGEVDGVGRAGIHLNPTSGRHGNVAIGG